MSQLIDCRQRSQDRGTHATDIQDIQPRHGPACCALASRKQYVSRSPLSAMQLRPSKLSRAKIVVMAIQLQWFKVVKLH